MTKPPIIGPFDRKLAASFDEIDWIASLLLSNNTPQSTMIDVGAHLGSVFKRFAYAGWTVHAFEPFPHHFSSLKRQWRHCPNVRLQNTAISDSIQKQLAFYASSESDGINSLTPFRSSHRRCGEVDATTLTAYIEAEKIDSVDFLKIDTEGYDYMVLKGFPWKKTRPRVLICEFENQKTIPLGYTYDEMAGLLQSQGYTVLASEWHPIARYGMRHHWRALHVFPMSLGGPDAWGNLVALRDDTDLQTLVRSANNFLSTNHSNAPESTLKTTGLSVDAFFHGSIVQGARVLIFGAGNAGLVACNSLRDSPCVPIGFLDNDPLKQGSRFCELPVYAPDALNRIDYDHVLIASVYAPSIYEQLRECQVPEGKISIFLLPVDVELQSEWKSRHSRKLEALRNKHAGNDCFIVGTGASIKHVDLSRLSKYHTIGTNLIHLLPEEAGFRPDYQIALNPIAISQYKESFQYIRHTTFLPYYHLKGSNLLENPNIVPISVSHGCGFCYDPRETIAQGCSNLHAALQLAYFMGFKNVFVLGADYSLEPSGEISGDPTLTIDSTAFPIGDLSNYEWLVPDPSGAEFACRQAVRAATSSCPPRRNFDATPHSSTATFSKLTFVDALSYCSPKAP